MLSLKDVKIGPKLTGLFLVMGILPLVFVGLWSAELTGDALMHEAFSELEGVREIKKGQVENYFKQRKVDLEALVETVSTLRAEAFKKLEAVHQVKKSNIEGYFAGKRNDVAILSSNRAIKDALEGFTKAFTAGNRKTGGSRWNAARSRHADWLEKYQSQYGDYDLFLISSEGDVVYTVAGESDLGENLKTGPLKDSGLGKLFAKAAGGTAIHDFEPYAPSNGEPAAFFRCAG